MNMQMLDWLILCAFIAMVIGFAIHASRLNRSVADFLSANRCARRYLLSTSDDVAGIGAVTFIAFFEMYYRTGFAGVWWNMFTWPLMLMISLAGWVIYRFRETRALTMAQFFEIRYSRRFRIFCGILAWTAGVINMGIFPAVTARFFIYFCGLPESISIGQLFSVQTFALIMVIELSIALMFVLFGGMIVIAITDFIQGLFCNIAFVIILLFLYSKFEWSQIITALESAPANASMLNPYKTTQTEGFSLWYFLMLAFAMFYGVRAWQGTQGFNSAAKNAHEAKMAGLLSRWRQIVSLLLLVSLPVCAFTILNHPDFKDTAVNIQSAISNIPNEQIAKQMTVPLVLSKVLPVGIMGLFAAIMFAAAISTDGACLHSWGSIFVQDVILPFRQKGFEPKKHILVLRLSCLFVAIFIFCFSMLFKQIDFIFMYMALTGAIFLGGAGAVIVGGLYWKRGTTFGAWSAMIIGGFLATTGILLEQMWPNIITYLMQKMPNNAFLLNHQERCPLNGMQINFIAMISAVLTYIGVSLFESFVLKKETCDLNRILHRGKYAITGEHEKDVVLPPVGLKAMLPGREFSRFDRIQYFAITLWTLVWLIVFIAVSIWNYLYGTSDYWWSKFWFCHVCISILVAVVTVTWFSIGGIRDLLYLYKQMNSSVRDFSDDGRVPSGKQPDAKQITNLECFCNEKGT